MKKLILLSVLFLIIAFGAIYILRQGRNVTVRNMSLKGDSQFIISSSKSDNQIVYGSMLFSEDSLNLNIYKNNKLVCEGFVYCNFINDSLVLAFDHNSQPFLVQTETGSIRKLDINVNFQQYNISSTIKVDTLDSHQGLFLNKGDTLVFFDLILNEAKTIFPVDEVYSKGQIESFDVYSGKILLCKQRECFSGSCSFDFFLVNPEKQVADKIYSINSKSISYSPSVIFLNDNTFLTNYYDNETYIIIRSIQEKNNISEKYSLGNLKVLNMFSLQNEICLTVLDEKIRKAQTSKNPYENLFRGMKVISLKTPIE